MKDVAVATRCLPHSLRVRSLKTELKAGLFANFCPLRLQGDGGWVRKSVAFGRLCRLVRTNARAEGQRALFDLHRQSKREICFSNLV